MYPRKWKGKKSDKDSIRNSIDYVYNITTIKKKVTSMYWISLSVFVVEKIYRFINMKVGS